MSGAVMGIGFLLGWELVGIYGHRKLRRVHWGIG
jgi:hypothetical protein